MLTAPDGGIASPAMPRLATRRAARLAAESLFKLPALRPAAACRITSLLRIPAEWVRADARTPNRFNTNQNALFRDGRSADQCLERPVGLLGEICVELPHFGSLGNKALIGRLRISGLNLDCLFE